MVSPDTDSIAFKDYDFELITRVSGPNYEETSQFVTYIRTFVQAMLRGSLKFLELKADIKMQRQDNYTMIEIRVK